MATAKQNLNLKIQMLAGHEAKKNFEMFFKNIPSLVITSEVFTGFKKILNLT